MPVTHGGKRKAAKRAAKRAVRLDPAFLLPAAGVTFCVIAWGYLVSAAIDFGAEARTGQSEAWAYLAIACLGAAACLFAGLMLGATTLSALGITGQDRPTGTAEEDAPPPAPRLPGGRRAKR